MFVIIVILLNDHESQATMKFSLKIFGLKVFVDSSFKGQLNLRKGVLLTVVVNSPAVTRADDSLWLSYQLQGQFWSLK